MQWSNFWPKITILGRTPQLVLNPFKNDKIWVKTTQNGRFFKISTLESNTKYSYAPYHILYALLAIQPFFAKTTKKRNFRFLGLLSEKRFQISYIWLQKPLEWIIWLVLGYNCITLHKILFFEKCPRNLINYSEMQS